MDAESKQKWIAALRSGDYKQARATLHHDGSYCCLGVWCAVNGYTVGEDSIIEDGDTKPYSGFLVAPDGSRQDCELVVKSEAIGVSTEMQMDLATMNDNGASFSDIADWIEAYIAVEGA
jgi:hypothetical protein